MLRQRTDCIYPDAVGLAGRNAEPGSAEIRDDASEFGLMPVVSAVEQGFSRSTLWQWVAERLVLPWALRGVKLRGDVLEVGVGTGAVADGVARAFPEATSW